MFGRTFKRQEVGKPIEAATINRPLDAIEGLLRAASSPPNDMQMIDGMPLKRHRKRVRYWARITGAPSGSAYPWQGIYSTTGGTWADLPSNISGTASVQPAYEANGVTTLTSGTRIEIEREPATGEWRFQLDKC